jgi:hypothetical protein
MRRSRPRLRLRTLVELVGLIALALGFRVLLEDTRPPRPEVKVLTRGTEAERIAAVRTIGLMGEPGAEAIPALIRVLGDDPSPAVRRGAGHALVALAGIGPGADLPIDEAIAGTPGPRKFRPPRPSNNPKLRPESEEVAAQLVRAMRADPDPTVRAYAVRLLRKLLDAACVERQAAGRPAKPGQPVPIPASTGEWVEGATRAVAGAVRDPDPEVRNHAIGFLAASRPAHTLLTPAEHVDAIGWLVREGAEPLPLEFDLLVLSVVSKLKGAADPDSPRLLELAAARMLDPPRPMIPSIPQERIAAAARAGYAAIFWSLTDSWDDLRDRPELTEVLIGRLHGNREQYMADADPPTRLTGGLGFYSADIHTGSGSSYFGGLHGSPPDPRSEALEAFHRDPRLIAHVWPRVDAPGRLGWLGDAGRSSAFGGDWNRLVQRLADPEVRPDLPSGECEAILVRLLAEPEPGREPARDSQDDREYRDLMAWIEFNNRGRPADARAITPEQAALEWRAVRALAVLTYFARGVSIGHESQEVVVSRLRRALESPEPTARRWSAELLGSLGAAAESALADLETCASSDPEEVVRWSARDATDRIRIPPWSATGDGGR